MSIVSIYSISTSYLLSNSGTGSWKSFQTFDRYLKSRLKLANLENLCSIWEGLRPKRFVKIYFKKWFAAKIKIAYLWNMLVKENENIWQQYENDFFTATLIRTHFVIRHSPILAIVQTLTLIAKMYFLLYYCIYICANFIQLIFTYFFCYRDKKNTKELTRECKTNLTNKNSLCISWLIL